jgi:hypothetical protein
LLSSAHNINFRYTINARKVVIKLNCAKRHKNEARDDKQQKEKTRQKGGKFNENKLIRQKAVVAGELARSKLHMKSAIDSIFFIYLCSLISRRYSRKVSRSLSAIGNPL